MIRPALFAGLVLCGIAFGATPLRAQQCNALGANASCSVNVSTSVTAPVLLRITVDAASSPFGTVSTTNFNDGHAEISGPAITVKANQTWEVHISSVAVVWTAVNTDISNPARTTKPVGDLLWATTLGGSYTPVTGTATSIGSGTRTAGTAAPVFFRSVWDYALDTPGNYSIGVTFTLVSP